MVYLLANVQNFADYGGKFKVGAKYAQDYISNLSYPAAVKKETQTELTASQPAKSKLINVVMQAREDDLGGLICAVNSIIVNTKYPVQFHFVVRDDTTVHLQ